MTWVKVCGLSTAADVDAAVGAGADAVGFVVAPESPRRVTIEQVRRLAKGVTATTVLVTVDASPSVLLDLADRTGVNGVQPHGVDGAAAAEAAAGVGLFALLPIPVRSDFTLPAPQPGVMRMFDTYRSDQHGGTGLSFDWDVLAAIEAPYVLAGGLNPDNIAGAIRAVKPWGVDASSSLEGAVGVKDHSKVAAFVREAKQA